MYRRFHRSFKFTNIPFIKQNLNKYYSKFEASTISLTWKTRVQNFVRFRIEEWKKGIKNIFTEAKDPTYIVLNLSLLIGFAGAAMPNELYLRYCAVLGSTGAIFFNSFAFHSTRFTPNLTIMFWDFVRILAHSSNISRIWHEQKDITFHENDAKIYTDNFMEYGFRPRHFLELLQHGKRKTYVYNKNKDDHHNNKIFDTKIHNTENTAKFILLLDGNADVFVDKSFFAKAYSQDPLCFLGSGVVLDLLDKGKLEDKHTKMVQQRINNYDFIKINDQGGIEKLSPVVGLEQENSSGKSTAPGMDKEKAMINIEVNVPPECVVHTIEWDAVSDALSNSYSLIIHSLTIYSLSIHSIYTDLHSLTHSHSRTHSLYTQKYILEVLSRDNEMAQKMKNLMHDVVRLNSKVFSKVSDR